MINFVDLFAGPGGLSLGLEMVRNGDGKKVFNLAKAAEYDQWACETLKKNHESLDEEIVIEGDIRNDEVKRKICSGRRKIDLLVGGPPCQSFSTLGPRSGNGNGKKDMFRYDNLYKCFVSIAEKLNPKFILFENVRGILSKCKGDLKVVDQIISDFKNLGYNFESENQHLKMDYIILNAADYGVPQMRERVFLIANNIGIKNPYPKRSHYNPSESRPLKGNLLPYVNLSDSIRDLPKLKAKMTMTGITKHRVNTINEYNRKVYSGNDVIRYRKTWFQNHKKRITKQGKYFFKFVRPNYKIPLTHHIARSHMKTDMLLFQRMKEGMTAKHILNSRDPKIRDLGKFIKYDMNSFTDKYRKQKYNKPSTTIFAHLSKDGNRFIHPDSKQARTFTPREAARIQSFPDDYYFEGPITKKFQQIGNAVPPLLAKEIGNTIFRSLNNQ